MTLGTNAQPTPTLTNNLTDNLMSDSYSTLDPQPGFTPMPAANTPSVSQAAHDLRVAAGEKARELKDRAVGSAQQIRDTASEKAAQLKQVASERATQLKSVASEKAQQFRETATEQWEETRAKAKEVHASAEDYVRANPTKSVLTALGVGVLIGLIVRR